MATIKPPGKRGTSRKKNKKKPSVLIGADDTVDTFYDETAPNTTDSHVEKNNDLDDTISIKQDAKEDVTDTNIEAKDNGFDANFLVHPEQYLSTSATKVDGSTDDTKQDNEQTVTEETLVKDEAIAKTNDTDIKQDVDENDNTVITSISNILDIDVDQDDEAMSDPINTKPKIPITKSKSKPLPKRMAKPLPLRDANSYDKPLPPAVSNCDNDKDALKLNSRHVENVDKTTQTWVIAKPKPKALSPKPSLKPLTPTSPKPPTPTFDPQALCLSPKQKRTLLHKKENSLVE
eukprot:442476_1